MGATILSIRLVIASLCLIISVQGDNVSKHRCYISQCGCPGTFKQKWCNADASFMTGWCGTKKTCFHCAGDWCPPRTWLQEIDGAPAVSAQVQAEEHAKAEAKLDVMKEKRESMDARKALMELNNFVDDVKHKVESHGAEAIAAALDKASVQQSHAESSGSEGEMQTLMARLNEWRTAEEHRKASLVDKAKKLAKMSFHNAQRAEKASKTSDNVPEGKYESALGQAEQTEDSTLSRLQRSEDQANDLVATLTRKVKWKVHDRLAELQPLADAETAARASQSALDRKVAKTEVSKARRQDLHKVKRLQRAVKNLRKHLDEGRHEEVSSSKGQSEQKHQSKQHDSKQHEAKQTRSDQDSTVASSKLKALHPGEKTGTSQMILVCCIAALMCTSVALYSWVVRLQKKIARHMSMIVSLSTDRAHCIAGMNALTQPILDMQENDAVGGTGPTSGEVASTGGTDTD